jgi:sec-independent protein translocase protein TatB
VLGINGPEFLVLALLALLVVGPDRLPQYAAQLGRFVREARKMASAAREQVRDEMGPEFDDIDWRKLDPRQYDPRRIVREALTDAFDDDVDDGPSVGRPGAGGASASVAGAAIAGAVASAAGAGGLADGHGESGASAQTPDLAAPFDTEAT